LTEFLAPVFFVQMGAKVDLMVFASPGTLWLALALTVAAILGKQICSLGVLEKGANRWAVGFGMIPRGEVGLILASIGATLILGGERIIDATTYSAVIIMVILTTLVTPPLLKWSLLSRNISGMEQEKHAGPG
jgi:Kef-type K+ transport system membrane component KefB